MKEIEGIISRTPHKIVKEVYKTLKKFSEDKRRQKWLDIDKDCYKCAIENDMWEEDEKREMKAINQVPVVFNRMNKGIHGSSAVVTDTNPEILFHPVGSDDLYVADILKRANDYIWKRNIGNKRVFHSCEGRQIGGIGALYSRFNRSKGLFGMIQFRDVKKISTVYWDADSEEDDLSDTHILIARKRSREYVRENYPDIPMDKILLYHSEPEIADADLPMVDTKEGEDNYNYPDAPTSDHKEDRTIWEIEAWMRRVKKEHWAMVFPKTEPGVKSDPYPIRIQVRDNGGNLISPEKFDQKSAVEQLMATGEYENVIYWPRMMEKRELVVLVGSAIVPQEDPDEIGTYHDTLWNPFGEDSNGDPIIPINIIRAQRTRDSFSRSPTFYSKDLNKSLNKRSAQLLQAVSKALNSPVVRTSGSKWTGSPDTPGSELLLDRNGLAVPPYRLPPGDVDISGLIVRMNDDKEAVDDQYDMTEIMKGKLPKDKDRVSGRAVLALVESGSTMSKPFLRDVEFLMNQQGKINLALAIKFWPRYVWERLLDEEELYKPPEGESLPENMDGLPAEKQLEIRENIRNKWLEAIDKIKPIDGGSGISMIDIDVSMTTGSSMPTMRMARQQVAISMYEANLYDRKAALSYSDDPNAEEISTRMEKREEELAKMQQSQGGV